MGGKHITYSSCVFYSDPNDPTAMKQRQQSSTEECPRYAKGSYHCSYLAYSNYSNTNHLTFNLGIEQSVPDYRIDNRNMNIYIFNCVIAGKGTFNGRAFGKGTCYYSKVRQCHSMHSDPDDPWLSVWFAVDGSVGKQLADRLDEKYPGQMFSFAHPEQLLKFAEFMLYDFKYIQQSDKYIRGVIDLLMTFLDPDPEFELSGDPSFTLHQRKIIRQSIVSIEKNIATVTVASLAEEARWEVKYFSKIFTLVAGLPPKEYIIRLKTEMAAHYLADTVYPVEEITAMLGYKHRNSLNAAFTKAYGMTPTEYRRRNSAKS